MERSFGADFSARARSRGRGGGGDGCARRSRSATDLHFAPGQYDPSSQQGQELLGHELAHVVQQRGGAVQGPQGRGAELAGSAGLEREADTAGARAARGESAQVTGTGGGIQFKKPQSRNFINIAREAESPKIAAAHLKGLVTRLTAKAELRFSTSEDGALLERLEAAAAAKVEEIADDKLTDAKQNGDVKALSAKIAQRSKAVKKSVSAKSASIADDISTSGAHEAAFLAAARAAFDTATPSRFLSDKIVVAQAISAAKSAREQIDEAEYQKAKIALDKLLLDPKGDIEKELTTASETNVETRARRTRPRSGSTRRREGHGDRDRGAETVPHLDEEGGRDVPRRTASARKARPGTARKTFATSARR